jgi:hypoxanthine phosphoribosyltransferase
MQCELISWDHFNQLSRELALKIKDSGYSPDIIIAIGRGGYMPARILSDYLDNMNLTSFKVEHYKSSQKEKVANIRYPLVADIAEQRVLLVDDVSDSGDTFNVAIEHIMQHAQPKALKTASLHHKVVSVYEPDYYVEKVTEWHWIIYPWAVIEDVAGFVKNISPLPKQISEIQNILLKTHGIEVPQQIIVDVLKLSLD